MSIKRVLIVAATTGYQTRMFSEVAERLGFGVLMATDRCHKLDDPWGDHAIPVRFEEPEKAAADLANISPRPNGVVAVGDRPTIIAAHTARVLGLPYNSPDTARACRSKRIARERFRAAGLPVPEYFDVPIGADPRAVLAPFPCVLKPLGLSASRGVIRADSESEFIDAFERIRAILGDPDLVRQRDELNTIIQVEEFIPGREYALEGLVTGGSLQTLGVFEKPDPLDGPYFEETIYLTPPRVSAADETRMIEAVERGVSALGITFGPVHAEYRVNDRGVWLIEIAARPIGGLCAKAVRFDNGAGLEELILRHAVGEGVSHWRRERRASGVMMIPIPANGIYRSVDGVEDAEAVPNIEEVAITAKDGQRIQKLPEGKSYLGFIFARAASTEEVDEALRTAHAKLRFHIATELEVVSSRADS